MKPDHLKAEMKEVAAVMAAVEVAVEIETVSQEESLEDFNLVIP